MNNIEWVGGCRVSEYSKGALCPLERRKLTVLCKAQSMNVKSETSGQYYQALLLLGCVLKPNSVRVC